MAERTVDQAPDLSRPRRIHVVGIGGAGMSAIATVLFQMGHTVTGSDASTGPVIARLGHIGIDVHVGHVPKVAAASDMLAVSSAIPADDPEVVEAGQRGIEVWSRGSTLAAICRQRRTVAVSGTHGKTTTSAMLAVILRETGWRPSMLIGGDIAGVGPGAEWELPPESRAVELPAGERRPTGERPVGEGAIGEWLVVEADESDGTFLQLGAEAVAVTSIASDHLDHYGTREELDRAFARFLSEARGPAVVCLDDPGAARVGLQVAEYVNRTPGRRLITYGTTESADLHVRPIELTADASVLSIEVGGATRGPIRVPVPGVHNVLNATAAIGLATEIGVPWTEAIQAIGAYRGVARRFEPVGTADGVDYIDDYAHNPEKVAAALATARHGNWNRVVAVFQPHRYSRTEALWREFGPALSEADVLIVTDVYGAGEAPRPGVTGRLIADAVAAARPGADVRYVDTLDEAEKLLREELRPGDLCLALGAGDVTEVPRRLLSARGNSGD